jgi:hypothetical protein
VLKPPPNLAILEEGFEKNERDLKLKLAQPIMLRRSIVLRSPLEDLAEKPFAES